MLDVVGLHVAMAFVGVGMSVLVFNCAAFASEMKRRAANPPHTSSLAWHGFRFLLGLACAALLSVAWLYLLLGLRIPLTAVAILLLSLFASAVLFFKFSTFGRVQLVAGQ